MIKKRHGSETEMLRRYPKTKLVLDYAIKRLEVLVVSLLTAGIIGGCNHAALKDNVKWIGQHLDEKQQQINQLKDSQ